MRTILAYLTALSVLQLLAACHYEPNPSLAKIVGGTSVTDKSPAFTSAVSIAKIKKDSFDSYCSGTLIAPNLVLTAAHCLEGIKAPNQLIVVFADNEKDPQAESRKVIDFQTYRIGEGARFFPNFDIAWIKLENTAPEPYLPAEILRSSDQLQDLLGVEDSILLAGYGRTSTGCSAADADCSGKRLEVQTFLRRYINTSHFWQLMVIGPKAKHGSCNGDSGGPAYAQIQGRWYVLGNLNGKSLTLNTSAVWDMESICESGESIFTFAGAYVDWIEKSSGIKLGFDDTKNPRGRGLLPLDSLPLKSESMDLASMLEFNNPNESLWVTSEALIANFGEESKRQIPQLSETVTDPVRAAAAMQTWQTFSYVLNFPMINRQISDLRPLGQLKQLKRLVLSGNRLVDTKMLENLKNLEELTLSNNYDFASKAKVPYDFSFLSHMPKLKVLNLSNNPSNLDLSSIPWANLQRLESLLLSSNNSLDLAKINFEKLPYLRRLSLSGIGVGDISSLGTASQLTQIDLKNNSIQDISVLGKLIKLEEVDLTQNLIEDFSSVAQLTELKTLRATGNPQKVIACPENAQCFYEPDSSPLYELGNDADSIPEAQGL